jgi:hypothetical protein
MRAGEVVGVAARSSAPRYALSFTSGSLLLAEASVVAPIYLRVRDWTKVRELLDETNGLQARTHATGKRRTREVVQRLAELTDEELVIMAEGTSTARNHLLWVAACRRYDLIAEFAEEVLRERFLTLAGTVTYEQYDSFYRAKATWHNELGNVTELSYKKLRQVLFKMMIEAGLLNKQGQIEPALLSPRVAECLNQRKPSDIRFFPTRVA